MRNLVGWQQFCAALVQSQFVGNIFSHFFCGRPSALPFSTPSSFSSDGMGASFLKGVVDHNMSRILAINGDVDDGSTWLQSCHWAPMLSIIFLLPTQTTLPFTLARIPCPAISSTSVTSQPSVASCGKAVRRAAPIGMSEMFGMSARCSRIFSLSEYSPICTLSASWDEWSGQESSA